MEIMHITALEAFELLQEDQNALLVDVRTQEEWNAAGMPDIAASNLVLISWRLKPDMNINPEFSDSLLRKIKSKDTKLIFLCRGGSRSNEAAQIATSHGFSNCYNIIDGFEGSAHGPGWRNSNLAYTI